MQVDVSILLPEKERMEDVEQGKKGETFGKNKKYHARCGEQGVFIACAQCRINPGILIQILPVNIMPR